MKEYVSARGAARILNVSRMTVTRWVDRGKLKPAGSLEAGDGENPTIVFERDYIERKADELRQAESTDEAVA